MDTTIQEYISEALDNLAMDMIAKKDVIPQLTRTMKQIEDINKITTEHVSTLTTTNTRLTDHVGKQHQRSCQATAVKKQQYMNTNPNLTQHDVVGPMA